MHVERSEQSKSCEAKSNHSQIRRIQSFDAPTYGKNDCECDNDLFEGSSYHARVRAAPLVRVKVKITVKNAVCEESSATAYGVFDREFGFRSHEWSCSSKYRRKMSTGRLCRVDDEEPSRRLVSDVS